MKHSRRCCGNQIQMMEDKNKPEQEQARYRKMLGTLSTKVVVLEAAAQTDELQLQAR